MYYFFVFRHFQWNGDSWHLFPMIYVILEVLLQVVLWNTHTFSSLSLWGLPSTSIHFPLSFVQPNPTPNHNMPNPHLNLTSIHSFACKLEPFTSKTSFGTVRTGQNVTLLVPVVLRSSQCHISKGHANTTNSYFFRLVGYFLLPPHRSQYFVTSLGAVNGQIHVCTNTNTDCNITLCMLISPHDT